MQIPKIWTEVLKSIQTVEPQAMIAGGALRDLDNGKPIKDLDIFIPLNWSTNWLMSDLIPFLGRGIDQSSNAEEYQNNDEVCGIFEFNIPELDIPVNLIICQPNDDFINFQLNRFDIGICKIAYDGDRIIKNALYDLDTNLKRIAIHNTLWLDSSIKRMNRLGEKYPGWTKVDLTKTI